MVKLSAGLLIIITILSVPFIGLAIEHGLVPTLVGVFITVVGVGAVFFSIDLIFKGVEELNKKK